MPTGLGPDANSQSSPFQHLECPDSSVPLSVLLQPARLSRANKQWPGAPTTRDAVLLSRAYWAHCLSLVKLSVMDFRKHLATNTLAHLPLPPTVGASLSQRLLPLLEEPLFWEAIAQADSILRHVEAHPCEQAAALAIWDGRYFRDTFAGQRHAHAWPQLALDVLCNLDATRTFALGLIGQRSNLLHALWQNGNFSALLAAQQEGLPCSWAQGAIATIEQEAREGTTKTGRRRAEAQRKQLDQARRAIGSGRTTPRTEQEALAAKRLSVSRARAAGRLLAYYERLLTKGFTQPAARRLTVGRFAESSHIVDPDEKKAILARFYERLSHRRENLVFSG